MNLLLLKIFLAPFLVAIASLSQRRWGAKVGGWMGALPIVAGPSLFLFALEHGTEFAAHAALRALLGLLAFIGFVWVYARVCKKSGLLSSMALGWLAYGIVAATVLNAPVGLVTAWGLALAGLFLAIRTMPKVDQNKIIIKKRKGHWLDADILTRMGATALLVVLLTSTAGLLGPQLSGVLAPFPVATSILVGFAHHRQGPKTAIGLLSGSLLTMFGFTVFCGTLAATLVPWGIALSFFAALFGMILVQTITLRVTRQR